MLSLNLFKSKNFWSSCVKISQGISFSARHVDRQIATVAAWNMAALILLVHSCRYVPQISCSLVSIAYMPTINTTSLLFGFGVYSCMCQSRRLSSHRRCCQLQVVNRVRRSESLLFTSIVRCVDDAKVEQETGQIFEVRYCCCITKLHLPYCLVISHARI